MIASKRESFQPMAVRRDVPQATALSKTILYDIIEHMHYLYPQSLISAYIDDVGRSSSAPPVVISSAESAGLLRL